MKDQKIINRIDSKFPEPKMTLQMSHLFTKIMHNQTTHVNLEDHNKHFYPVYQQHNAQTLVLSLQVSGLDINQIKRQRNIVSVI